MYIIISCISPLKWFSARPSKILPILNVVMLNPSALEYCGKLPSISVLLLYCKCNLWLWTLDDIIWFEVASSEESEIILASFPLSSRTLNWILPEGSTPILSLSD